MEDNKEKDKNLSEKTEGDNMEKTESLSNKKEEKDVEKTEELSEKKADKPDEENSDGVNVDASVSETDAITTPQKKDRIEEDNDQVSTSFLKLDEKTKAQVRELLQDDLKNGVQDVKKDFLVIFGLFASFVIFISVNIQVFKNNENIFELIGVSSISLSFIIYFALIINGISKGNTEWKDLKGPSYIINLIFLIMGIIFLSIGGSKSKRTIIDLERKVFNDSIQLNHVKSDLKNLKNKTILTDSILMKLKSKIDKPSKNNDSKDFKK